jgi:hypothetical protein
MKLSVNELRRIIKEEVSRMFEMEGMEISDPASKAVAAVPTSKAVAAVEAIVLDLARQYDRNPSRDDTRIRNAIDRSSGQRKLSSKAYKFDGNELKLRADLYNAIEVPENGDTLKRLKKELEGLGITLVTPPEDDLKAVRAYMDQFSF